MLANIGIRGTLRSSQEIEALRGNPPGIPVGRRELPRCAQACQPRRLEATDSLLIDATDSTHARSKPGAWPGRAQEPATGESVQRST